MDSKVLDTINKVVQAMEAMQETHSSIVKLNTEIIARIIDIESRLEVLEQKHDRKGPR